jgi:hypothetical protein
MEFVQSLINTPAPTLLVLGGLILLVLGLVTFKKPIVIDVTPTNRKISLVLGIVLIVVGVYLLSLQIPEQTPEASATAIVTLETPSPVTSSPQSASPVINTSSPLSVTGFENNCIDSDIWTSYKGGTIENKCWQLQKSGISAQEDGLLFFVDKNQTTDWFGVYTDIPQNVDIHFDIRIDKFLTPNNDAARIAVGIVNPDDPIAGNFLYYREVADTSSVRIELGDSISNAIRVGVYKPYGLTQKVTISIRGIALKVFIDNIQVNRN